MSIINDKFENTNKSSTLISNNIDACMEVKSCIVQSLKVVALENDITLPILLRSAFALLISNYSYSSDIKLITNSEYGIEDIICIDCCIDQNTALPEYIKVFYDKYSKCDHDWKVSNSSNYDFLNESLNEKCLFIITENNSIDSIKLLFKKYKIQLIISFSLEDNKITFKYNKDYYDSKFISRLFKNYITIIQSIIYNQHTKLCLLSYLDSDEYNRVLYKYNQTQNEDLTNQSISKLFEKQAELTPNKTAAIFNDKEITYSELNLKSNKLSNYLKAKGVKPGTSIGIMLYSSVEEIIAILGILKLGCAYVPIDNTYSNERINYIINDCDIKTVLTFENLNRYINNSNIQSILLDTDWDIINNEKDICLDLNISGNQLAYINYTSGSTGKPKGVMIKNKGVVRLAKDKSFIKLVNDGTFLHGAPITFDASTFEIWVPLLNGGTVVIVTKNTMLSTKELANTINRYNVVNLWLTSALFSRLVDIYPMVFDNIKTIITGGDVVSKYHVKKLLSYKSSINIINGYGPTENTTFSCCYNINKTDKLVTSIPIGRPICNTNVFILNQYLKPKPIGIAGDIYVGGDGLAQGYVNMPDKTAKVFLKNHINPKLSKYIYKTGDIGRWLPDGNIEFIGRLDSQVKIRGYRIEITEVENSILSIEGVNECSVISFNKPNTSKRLAAFIVANNDIPSDKIKSHLENLIPNYEIPSLFIQLNSLPLTINGKIDKNALLKYIDELNCDNSPLKLPYDDTEKLICRIWEDVLNVKYVSIDKNFFDLGGDSLLLMSLYQKLCEKFNNDFGIVKLFEYPTIKSFAEYLNSTLKKN